MQRLLYISAFLLGISGQLRSQDIGMMDRDGLQNILAKSTDTVYVLNFWATWCSPCVAEIGYFEELHKSYSDRKLQVILINLDFPNQVDRRVKTFVEEKNISAPVMNMQDLDYDSWIHLVDSSWSGAIPATLIFRNETRSFMEAAISKEELFEAVKLFY